MLKINFIDFRRRFCRAKFSFIFILIFNLRHIFAWQNVKKENKEEKKKSENKEEEK